MPQTSLSDILSSPAFITIAAEYNEKLARDGKVQLHDFYKTYIKPNMPGYARSTFYYHVSKFAAGGFRYETNDEGVPVKLIPTSRALLPDSGVQPDQNGSSSPLPFAESPTMRGIASALEAGATALEKISKDPTIIELIPAEKRAEYLLKMAELLFKGMRAQDARANVGINARRELRGHKAFELQFADAAFQVPDLVDQDQ